MEKLQVGQELWYVPTYGKRTQDNLFTCKVTKVGRKYAYTNLHQQIDIETLKLKTDYTSTQFYLSKEALIEDRFTIPALRAKVKEKFNDGHGLSRGQLERILEILNNN